MSQYFSKPSFRRLTSAKSAGEPLTTVNDKIDEKKNSAFFAEIEVEEFFPSARQERRRIMITDPLPEENASLAVENAVEDLFSYGRHIQTDGGLSVPKRRTTDGLFTPGTTGDNQPEVEERHSTGNLGNVRALATVDQKSLATRPLTTGSLHDVSATQSLVSALLETMEPQKHEARMPVVIPGARKRTGALIGSTTIGGGQAGLSGDSRPIIERHMPRMLKSGLTLGALMLCLCVTLLTFTPAGQGQTGIGAIDSTIKWVQLQQDNFDLTISGRPVPKPAAPKTAVTIQNDSSPATMNLPKSEYIAIAQQAAINAGISPVYFVNQINAESGFNPNAYSPAGAVGIAQFLPSTAAGLGINPYDPVSALNGAAHYMARLAASFNGDYAKALAAYNAGSGAVNNAVAAAGTNWLSLMPYETQNYVRKIMGY